LEGRTVHGPGDDLCWEKVTGAHAQDFVVNDELLLTNRKTLEKFKAYSPLQKLFDVFSQCLGVEECRS
jgi:hypothetical protein